MEGSVRLRNVLQRESVNAISKLALDGTGLVKEREPPSLEGGEIDPCPVGS
jgi:hypothetical protein